MFFRDLDYFNIVSSAGSSVHEKAQGQPTIDTDIVTFDVGGRIDEFA